jgi:ribosomal protein S6--L-glutamate ligase
MILSYHPCFVADKNLLCAGREPDANDLEAIKSADAVILPQGCYQSLYEMARNNCSHVFPNFDARFKYTGKIGQAKLFQEQNVAHPKTETYLNLDAFSKHYNGFPHNVAFDFPFVFKFDWGGEGDRVYLIKSASEFINVLRTAEKFEKTGQAGFIIQEYIPSKNRSLRVVVIGRTYISYWRFQKDTKCFCSNIAKGAEIDSDSDPDLQAAAVSSVIDFCFLTGINMAGFDVLFVFDKKIKNPLFLEINYYFGRKGLGGSEKFYEILNTEITKWLARIFIEGCI